MDAEFLARLFGIIVIDLALAGDNALVIALAVRDLPRRQQFWGRVWGSAGAVGLRLAFIAVATYLLEIPFLQAIGGLLLVGIAWKLVRPQGAGGDHGARQGASLREAIWIIVVADAVMSLDNVLGVAAAAHGDMVLVALGIGLSLPLVVWGSGLLSTLMIRMPAIVWLGGGILGYVAVEMILRDAAVGPRLADLPGMPALPVVAGVVMAGLGWWFARGAGRQSRARA